LLTAASIPEVPEPAATPVAADKISQYNTFVKGVTLTTPEAGKAVFSFGEEVTWPSDQEPNESSGADPDLVYVDLLVTAPAGATQVLIGEEKVPLDDEINGTLPTGRLFYFPVAQKDSEDNIVGFAEAQTWNLTIKWYNDDDEIVAVETLEVTREAYIASTPVDISSFKALEAFNDGTSTIGIIDVEDDPEAALLISEDFTLSDGKTLIVPSGKFINVPSGKTFTLSSGADAKLEDGTTQILAFGTCVVESGANLIIPKEIEDDKVFFSYIGTGEDAFYQLTDGDIEITIVNSANIGVTIKGRAVLKNAKVDDVVIRNTEQLWSGDVTTIAAGGELTIDSNTVLDVQEGATLTNNGTLTVNGKLKVSGTLNGSGTLDVHGTLDAASFDSFDSLLGAGTIVAYAGSKILVQEETPSEMIGESGLNADSGRIVISRHGDNGTLFTLPAGSTATVNGSFMDGDSNGYRIAQSDCFTVQGTLNIDYRTEVSGKLVVDNGEIVVGAKGEIYLFDASSGSGQLSSAAGTVTGTDGATVTFNSSDGSSTLNGETLTKGDSYNWSNNGWDKVTP